MPVLTVSAARRLDDEAATLSIREIAAYLQEAVGQRVAAAIAGLAIMPLPASAIIAGASASVSCSIATPNSAPI